MERIKLNQELDNNSNNNQVIDSNGIKYKIINDTAYHVETPEQVINILEDARLNRFSGSSSRLRLYFGDNVTGKDWEEIYDVSGYIGRSTGTIKVPLLINNSRSTGGGALLDHCIVKIETSKGKELLYKHHNYHRPNKYTVDITLRIKNWDAENEKEAKKEILERLEQFHILQISKPINFKFKDQKGVYVK